MDTLKKLMVVPTNESKEKIKKYEKLWIKIRALIRSITKNSDDYDKKYMKIKDEKVDKVTSDDKGNSDDKVTSKYNGRNLDHSKHLFVFLKIGNIIHKFSLMNVCIKYKHEKQKWIERNWC